MKFILAHLLFAFSIVIMADTKQVEPGRFVKDIKIKELKFDIPKIQPETLSENVLCYSQFEDEFPIVYLEIHFYSGESSISGYPMELGTVLADSWKYGGSEKLPESSLIEKLEAMGAKLGISSGYNKTILSVSYLSRDEDTILEFVEDLILKPAFTEKSIQNAKKKVIEAIARRNERTESLGFRKAREWIYRDFKRGIVASKETTEKVNRDMILDFFQDMVKNKKKAIVLSGKFNQEKTRAKLNTLLQTPNTSKAKFSEEKIDLSKMVTGLQQDKRKQILVSKDVNQSMVIYFGALPQHNHPDFFAIQLLNYIIGGGGFNSYMMQQIREERGLAYSAASYPSFEETYGLIFFYTLTKNESMKEADSLIQKILSQKTFNEINPQELEDAKNAIINQFVFLFTNKHSILSAQLGFDEDKMPENYLEIYRDKIRQVSLEDLRRVGKEYFEVGKLKSVFVSSKENLEKIFPNQKIIEPEDSILE
jgi:zinc protease